MAMLTKEEYKFYKSQDPKELTQEELNLINEYESAEANMPSDEDVQWATFVLNTKDPQDQKILRESGEYKRAYDIISQQRAARNLMIKSGKSPYVRQVKEVPDDVAPGYGFKFNWKDAYEQEKGETLRQTEADADKLKKYISSKMFDVDDDVKLQKVAYDMHLYNPNTMTWEEFLKSPTGDNFRAYLSDVQKNQKDKALEEIWNSEPMVDFMLPVSKEYAKNNYENIEGASDLVGPLAADVGANLAMTGRLPLVKSPTVRAIYGNVAAPLITEGSNVIANDKPLDLAAVNALEGTLINANAPMFLRRGGNWLENFAKRGGTTGEALQKTLNEAASKAREVAKRQKAGHIWQDRDQIKKLVKGKETVIQPTAKDLKNIIPDSDIQLAERGRMAKLFGLTEGEKKARKMAKISADRSPERKVELAKKIASGQVPTSDEIRRSGFSSSESFMNWLSDNVPEALSSYLTNLAGRPKIGQRGMGSIINVYAPDVQLFKDKSEREKGSDKWYRYYGLK